MSLKVRGTHPQEFKSSMPDYVEDSHTAYGYTASRLRPPEPSSTEIPLMDEIIDLIRLVPNPHQKKVLQLRSLVRPISGAHFFSWAKLANEMHSDHKHIKSLHRQGLRIIAHGIKEPQISHIRLGLDLRAEVLENLFGPSLSP